MLHAREDGLEEVVLVDDGVQWVPYLVRDCCTDQSEQVVLHESLVVKHLLRKVDHLDQEALGALEVKALDKDFNKDPFRIFDDFLVVHDFKNFVLETI